MIETNALLDSEIPRLDERRRQKHSDQLTLTSREFVSGFVPPDYLVDGLMQRRYVYSLTGKTGAGKTAIALLLTAQLSRGLAFGPHDIDQGNTLYLAGENPDDIRMRWIAMGEAMGYEPGELSVQFTDGCKPIDQIVSSAAGECELLDLVVVDTAATFFDGTDENDNVQMLAYAKKLRQLSQLPGQPTVLVLCHPIKSASNDNLEPRGGGSFLNEMDGNFTARLKDGVIEMHWHKKFRGRDFEPISFHLGRAIHTVMVRPRSDADRADVEEKARRDEDAILIVLDTSFDGLQADLATTLGWFHSSGSPAKSRVHRALQNLLDDGLVRKERDKYVLTTRGEKEAKRVA